MPLRFSINGVQVQDEGTTVGTFPTLNFIGAIVQAVANNGVVDITVSGVANVTVENTVFVMKNGNDGTGLIERFDRPFLTIAAARAAAIAGFTGGDAPSATNRKKIVVYSGDYAEQIILDPFIDYDLSDTTITLSTANTPIITDAGIVCDSIISGSAVINQTAAAGASANCIRLTAASTLSIRCKSLQSASVAAPTINTGTATFNLICDTVTSAAAGSYCSSGQQNIKANFSVTTEGIFISTTGTQNFYGNITSSNGVAVQNTNGTQNVWGNLSASQGVVMGGTGTVRLYGNIAASGSSNAAISISASGTVLVYGNVSSATAKAILVTSGTADIKGNINCTSATAGDNAVVCSGGTIKIKGDIEHSVLIPLQVVSGTVIITGRIVATGVNQSAATKSGGTLILDSCTLIATGTGESVTAGAAQNVLLYGASQANANENANITFLVGSIVVDPINII